MPQLFLTEPATELEKSHAELIQEFRDHNEELAPWPLEKVGNDFADYVEWLKDQSRGIGLNEGFVPNSTFWLVADSEIVGVANIRHELTPALMEFGGHIGYGVKPSARRKGYATKMLELSLGEVRKLGIDKVRITCDKDNIASAKTIERNGGVLDSEKFLPEHGSVIRRYWIHLD
jgi:predicted acetyltransferase